MKNKDEITIKINTKEWTIYFVDENHSELNKRNRLFMSNVNPRELKMFVLKGMPKKLTKQEIECVLEEAYLESYLVDKFSMDEMVRCIKKHKNEINEQTQEIINHHFDKDNI